MVKVTKRDKSRKEKGVYSYAHRCHVPNAPTLRSAAGPMRKTRWKGGSKIIQSERGGGESPYKTVKN